MFFQIYGNMFLLYLAEKQKAMEIPEVKDARELPFVKEALAAIAEGGYPEALARISALLMRRGKPIPLSRMDLKGGVDCRVPGPAPGPGARPDETGQGRTGDHCAL